MVRSRSAAGMYVPAGRAELLHARLQAGPFSLLLFFFSLVAKVVVYIRYIVLKLSHQESVSYQQNVCALFAFVRENVDAIMQKNGMFWG